MTAFATPDDLGLRMKRQFTSDESAWVTALLEDAAVFMRGVMRSQVYPPTQSTFTAYPVRGRVNLPPLVSSVDAVVQDGLPIRWKQFEELLFVECNDPTQVTITHGLATVPSDLVGINCAIVAQMMLLVEAGIGLTAGGLSSVALDDYKVAFADAGASTGMAMTDATKAYLETHYGQRAWTVDVV